MPATTFTHNGTVLTFTRSPLRLSRSRRKVQGRVQSAAGERIGQPAFGANDLIDLVWQSMSAVDMSALVIWWADVAHGMGREFVYTDINGTSYTVRFATPARPQVREKAYNSYECRTQLRITS